MPKVIRADMAPLCLFGDTKASQDCLGSSAQWQYLGQAQLGEELEPPSLSAGDLNGGRYANCFSPSPYQASQPASHHKPPGALEFAATPEVLRRRLSAPADVRTGKRQTTASTTASSIPD